MKDFKYKNPREEFEAIHEEVYGTAEEAEKEKDAPLPEPYYYPDSNKKNVESIRGPLKRRLAKR